MDVSTDGQLVELAEAGIRVLMVTGSRRPPSAGATLRGLVGEVSGVPADDVELVHACAVCGARHGRVAIGYPLTPSGAPWYADVAVCGDAVLAAATTRHPLGVGMEPATLDPGVVIDEAAFHASERDALDELDPTRRPLVRAALWARKTAFLRAVGHSDFLEPSRLALTIPGADGGEGRIARSAPEFDSVWQRVRFHDVPVPGDRVASVAVIG
ncbi:4'-phosphopantetheinyl transferase family protein [Agromyces sp. Marseille-P2726]|uniref:4'-phosphopantetheinyl transferase family protein n=1 Tax=Agromyces sp. Marseille-P2726 TaxID=2709132 RepID=UPI00156DE1A1|nr:4'-phosphopantetheinyl transferase family protein [Agromyces sp. Marseille-P2726]